MFAITHIERKIIANRKPVLKNFFIFIFLDIQRHNKYNEKHLIYKNKSLYLYLFFMFCQTSNLQNIHILKYTYILTQYIIPQNSEYLLQNYKRFPLEIEKGD